jgi:hypothetical protein
MHLYMKMLPQPCEPGMIEILQSYPTKNYAPSRSEYEYPTITPSHSGEQVDSIYRSKCIMTNGRQLVMFTRAYGNIH